MSDDTSGPIVHFTSDHRACDQTWAEVEAAVDAGDDAAAKAAWQRFETSMRRHFAMEEEVLFPAFEEATGMLDGPTSVMRMEHGQMRGLLDQMAGEAASENYQAVVDLGDTLLMIIQQHNVKEEGMLYPMAEQALAAKWPELLARLSAY